MADRNVCEEFQKMNLYTFTPPADRSNRICNNVLDLVGNTPLVYLNSVTKGLEAKIACKVEYFNPACSVKDRPGSFMIEKAERDGLIKPGHTVLIEGTSGNMGIAQAWTATVKNYKLILVMPNTMSLERRTLLKAFGAEFVLVDYTKGFAGVLERVEELAKMIPNSFVLNQFTNISNIEAHYNTTGPEIWRQTEGKVDIVVFGTGSGGTMSGTGKYLKEQNPNIKVFAVEPYESSLDLIQFYGIGAGVILENIKPIYEGALRVKTEEAVEMAKRIAREEGLLAGVSGGANVHAAIQLAKMEENRGKLIVTNLPDFGERYLSTLLYADIKNECEKMEVTTISEDRINLSKILGIEL
ncbi:Cystathionine beta-synthase [Aphelenchoides bicaudatus]|nr:Cystathionine beta-synthase [Aphelenchoides bicaudatus]